MVRSQWIIRPLLPVLCPLVFLGSSCAGGDSSSQTAVNADRVSAVTTAASSVASTAEDPPASSPPAAPPAPQSTTNADPQPSTSSANAPTSNESTTQPTSAPTVTTTATSSTTSTPTTALPNPTTEATTVAPEPELPSQAFTIRYRGGNPSALQALPCVDSCVIEIFNSQFGAQELSWTAESGVPVSVSDPNACLTGNGTTAYRLDVGETCAIDLAADGTGEYAPSSATVVFKASPVYVISWRIANLNIAENSTVAPDTLITFDLIVERDALELGAVGMRFDNVSGDGDFQSFGPGTQSVAVSVEACGQPTGINFVFSIGGTTYADPQGPRRISWDATPC